MADADFEDDLFADLYEDDAKPAAQAQPAAPAPPVVNGSTVIKNGEASQPEQSNSGGQDVKNEEEEEEDDEIDINLGGNSEHQAAPQHNQYEDHGHGRGPTGGNKDDGKMFIGGLNWETTDQSLKDYFSQFGEVLECTVMRDGASGRSRGFGFLTFKDARCVNVVMVKEHYLDGKIIDPKRAIPRDEQERTSKIFVGGVSQEASEGDFKEYFMQFGRVVDATLMMDKDTGRPRGFGFVTFDSEAAVEACLSQPLEILGKPIEVKKAQPRGNVRDEESDRGGHGGGRFGGRDNFNNQQGGGMMGQAQGGMTPQLMAQYWQRMQQYMAMMQSQMQRGQMQGMGGMPGGGMNPQMMMQMQQMQQMQAQAAQQGAGGRSQSPSGPGAMGMGGPGIGGGMGGMGQMNPMMMQQMMQQQAMAAQAAQGQGQHAMSPQPGMPGSGPQQMGGPQGPAQNQRQASQQPAYNAYEQQQFEQQKYEQQAQQPYHGQGKKRQASAQPQQQKTFTPHGQPTSWEGMYDDVPQPTPPGGHPNKKQRGASSTPVAPNPNAPVGAPTGPKNAGKPGANYRGGGRGSRGGFHPYSR